MMYRKDMKKQTSEFSVPAGSLSLSPQGSKGGLEHVHTQAKLSCLSLALAARLPALAQLQPEMAADGDDAVACKNAVGVMFHP